MEASSVTRRLLGYADRPGLGLVAASLAAPLPTSGPCRSAALVMLGYATSQTTWTAPATW